MEFIPVLVLILIIIYIINIIMQPEKHKVGLIVLAIIVAFVDVFGASDKKKRR